MKRSLFLDDRRALSQISFRAAANDLIDEVSSDTQEEGKRLAAYPAIKRELAKEKIDTLFLYLEPTTGTDYAALQEAFFYLRCCVNKKDEEITNMISEPRVVNVICGLLERLTEQYRQALRQPESIGSIDTLKNSFYHMIWLISSLIFYSQAYDQTLIEYLNTFVELFGEVRDNDLSEVIGLSLLNLTSSTYASFEMIINTTLIPILLGYMRQMLEWLQGYQCESSNHEKLNIPYIYLYSFYVYGNIAFLMVESANYYLIDHEAQVSFISYTIDALHISMKTLALIPQQNRTLMCRVLYFLSAALNGLIASPLNQDLIQTLVTQESFMIIKSLLKLRYSRTISGVLRVLMYLLNLSTGLILDVTSILSIFSEIIDLFSITDTKIRAVSFDCCLTLFKDHPYVLTHDQSVLKAMGKNLRGQSKTQVLTFIDLFSDAIANHYLIPNDIVGSILQGIVDILPSLPERKADEACSNLFHTIIDTIPNGLELMEHFGILNSLEAYENYSGISLFLNEIRSSY